MATARLSHAWKAPAHTSRPPGQTAAAHKASIVQLLVLCTVLTAPIVAHAAEGRGVFAADSFKADLTLAVVKNRKAGPNHTVGPVPAGVAWDGEYSVVLY